MEEELNEEDNIVKSEQSFFSDWKLVQSWIDELCSEKWEQAWIEKWEWISTTLLVFQEQPTLLSPYLESFVVPITNRLLYIMESLGLFKSDSSKLTHFQRMENPQFHALCKILQLFCRIRGFKHVVKYFPHEVSHIEACMFTLNAQDKNDYLNWETRYILLLWLYILVLIPFDICSIDSSLNTNTTTSSVIGKSGEEKKSKLIIDIITLCKEQLSESGPTRDAASSCLSVLFTRPDIELDILSDFISWCNIRLDAWTTKGDNAVSELNRDSFQTIGILHCLSQIFKRGHRNNLYQHAITCLSSCIKISEQTNQTLVRKLIIKVFQRIGLIFLPPREAKWRYQRGNRSLLQNLLLTDPKQPNNNSNQTVTSMSLETTVDDGQDGEEDDDDMDVPSDLEDIVGKLLLALQDKDTVVRWSAAKGIGRITMRLPIGFGDDIVSAVIATFTDDDSENGWHGACLALAELSRRGLLLPKRLSEVVPIVAKAIHYDVMKGQHSVGTHVRDAACYVCWAFARAYAPIIMRPFVQPLAEAMILTALFDREINCRRAASAAFQENVGRQGNENFPNGIDIITLADYFSLGNRNNAYLNISPSIALLSSDLHKVMMSHLSNSKLMHWDYDVRVLTSKALGRLSRLNIDFGISTLQEVLPMCLSSNMSQRHGAVLSVAEIVSSISFCNHEFTPELIEEISQVVFKIDKARLYRGRGSEHLRHASCYLIENIAKAHLAIPVKVQVSLVETLNENLHQPHENIQNAAANALRQMLFSYFPVSNEPSERLQQLTVLRYMNGLNNEENVAHLRGYALALGALPVKLVKMPVHRMDEIIKCLERATDPTTKYAGEPDAEVRRNAVYSLVELAEKLAISNLLPDSGLSSATNILCLLFKACEDYSVDKRGDTGSWSRIAALKGIERVVCSVLRSPSNNFPSDKKSMFSYVPIIALDKQFQNSFFDPLKLQIGYHVMTSYGHGVIDSITIDSKVQQSAKYTVNVMFPPQSLGHVLSNADNVSCTVEIKSDNVVVIGCSWSYYEKHSQGKGIVIPNHDERENFMMQVCSKDIINNFSSYSDCPMAISEIHIKNAMNVILQQLGEKLDTVREVAGGVLERMVRNMDPFIFCLPDRYIFQNSLSKITNETSSNNNKVINWSVYKLSFNFLVNILESNYYFESIILGIVISIGGLSESIVKESSTALLNWCQEKKDRHNVRELGHLGNTIVSIFDKYNNNNRVIIPLLKTLCILLRNGVFDCFQNSYTTTFASDILNALCSEVNKCTDIVKIRAAIDVLMLLLMFSDPVRPKALRNLVVLLGNKYPKVRKYAAEQLYIQLISDAHVIGPSLSDISSQLKDSEVMLFSGCVTSSDKLDETMEILTTTAWSEDIELSREKRARLCAIMDIELTTVTKTAVSTKTTKKKVADELDSYDALVRDAGY